MNKEKIEEILRTHSVVSNIQGVRFIGLCTHVGAYKDVKKPYDREVGALIKKLSTLIQEERKDAVRGFVDNIGWKKPSEVIDLADDVIDGRSLVKQMEAYLQSLDKGDTDDR